MTGGKGQDGPLLTTNFALSGRMNGYGPSVGLVSARAAVAEHVSRNPNVTVRPDNVILVRKDAMPWPIDCETIVLISV